MSGCGCWSCGDADERVDGVDLWDVLTSGLRAAGQMGDLDAARALVPRLAERQLNDQQRAVALQWTATFEMSDGRPLRGLALLDEALALFEGQPPSPQLDELLADRVASFMQLGWVDDARTDLRRGLEVSEALGHERSRRRWTALSMWVTMRSGDPEGAVAIGKAALVSATARPDPMADLELAVTATDVMLHTAATAREVEALASGTLREIEAYDLVLSNGSVLLRGNVAWAYLVHGDVLTAREWLGPVTSSDPDPNTALVHYLLGAIELREGDVKHAVDRCLDASAQIRAHGQSWINGVPWLAEVELWAGRVEPALQVLEEALEVTLPTQALMTAAIVCWCARAHADRLDAARAPASERRRLVDSSGLRWRRLGRTRSGWPTATSPSPRPGSPGVPSWRGSTGPSRSQTGRRRPRSGTASRARTTRRTAACALPRSPSVTARARLPIGS